MRLSLCVLLVTLALSCYEANARVCPAFASELRSFFLEPEELYNIHIQKFLPSREAAEAKIKVKKWIDLMPLKGRMKVFSALKNVFAVCNK
ncbi:secretoglobin family 1D member 2-like [Artibeus jamaicensis]|uniref:secretoglobin family 1D member 2-like n=1 Tax=Artibeus jamaicensis TaxID=9417 RepID=UPI00235B1DB2|nr:secretoglobin family 1D member 2-like [Artibeus jamaicensis]